MAIKVEERQKEAITPPTQESAQTVKRDAKQAKSQLLAKDSRETPKAIAERNPNAPTAVSSAKDTSVLTEPKKPGKMAANRAPVKDKLARLRALLPASTRLFDLEALVHGELVLRMPADADASFIPSDAAVHSQISTILRFYQKHAAEIDAHAHKLRELKIFPSRDFSALPNGMAPTFSMFTEEVQSLLRDSKKWACDSIISKMHDTLHTFKRLCALQSALPALELKLGELKQRNCLYSSTWMTELGQQHDTIREYVSALWLAINNVPVTFDMRKSLMSHWNTEARCVRDLVNNTGSKFAIYIGVSSSSESHAQQMLTIRRRTILSSTTSCKD